MSDARTPAPDIRTQIRDCVHRLEHLLPGQAPIRDFVHHNTLQGFQADPFPVALARARQITGNRGYPTPARFRAYLAEGRITREDLLAVIDEAQDLEPDRVLLGLAEDPDRDQPLRRRDLYLAALCHPIGPIGAAQLHWRIDEERALGAFQPNLDPSARQRLLADAKAEGGTADEAGVVAGLWSACLAALELEQPAVHPEELTDLEPEQAERLLIGGGGDDLMRQVRQDAAQQLQALLDRLGPELTLSGLLRALTGEDLMDQMRPQLVRHLSGFLDEGFAPGGIRRRRGPLSRLAGHSAARSHSQIPRSPSLGPGGQIAPGRSAGGHRPRLEHLSAPVPLSVLPGASGAEVPGWSGMVLCGTCTPTISGPVAVSMLDYLALRLVLERIYAQRLCRELWQIEPSLDMLRWYLGATPRSSWCVCPLPVQLPSSCRARRAHRRHLGPCTRQRDWKPTRPWSGLAAGQRDRVHPPPHAQDHAGPCSMSPSIWGSPPVIYIIIFNIFIFYYIIINIIFILILLIINFFIIL